MCQTLHFQQSKSDIAAIGVGPLLIAFLGVEVTPTQCAQAAVAYVLVTGL